MTFIEYLQGKNNQCAVLKFGGKVIECAELRNEEISFSEIGLKPEIDYRITPDNVIVNRDCLRRAFNVFRSRRMAELIGSIITLVRRFRKQIIIVTSAFRDDTNLRRDFSQMLAGDLDPDPDGKERLMVMAEQTTNAALAIALSAYGIPTQSLTGGEAGICCTGDYQDARITQVDPYRISSEFNHGNCVVVSGYQGVYTDKNGKKGVRALGRGGSDYTALALASAFSGNALIFTDVRGVFDQDPKVNSNAKQIFRITHDQYLQNYQQVMQDESVRFAKEAGLGFWVGSGIETSRPGTVFLDPS